MSKTMTWKERVLMIILVLLVGILGGISAFYVFYSYLPKTNSTITEKVTEKQVYIEKSPLISGVTALTQNLVVFLDSDQMAGLAVKNDKLELDCFNGAQECQRLGVILTSDGLVVSAASLDEKDLSKWIAVDSLGDRFQLIPTAKLGYLQIYQMVKIGELKLPAEQRSALFNLKPVLLADSSLVNVGQEVLGVESFGAGTLKISNGLVSGKLDRRVGIKTIDATFVPYLLNYTDQLRGKLVFDLSGELLAIRSENSADTVTAEQVKSLLKRFSVNRQHPGPVSLGVKCLNLDKMSALQLNYKVDYGCLLLDGLNSNGAVVSGGIIKKSLAEKGGLRSGDIILEVDDNSLLKSSLGQLMLDKAIGEKVDLLVLRDGKTIDLTIDLF